MKSMLRAMAVVVMGGVVSGCVALGAVAYKAVGDPKTPAEYKPENAPTLVLVENYQNPDQYRDAAMELERDIGIELKDNKVTQVIEVEKLEDLRAADEAAYRKMRIDQVGKAVGAKQVIYVNLVKFSASTPIGSGEMSGLAEALVRVVDVKSGQTLWPVDTSAGRHVKYETKHEEAVDFSNHSEVRGQMAAALGSRIARLFYDSPQIENDVAPKN